MILLLGQVFGLCASVGIVYARVREGGELVYGINLPTALLHEPREN